MPAMNAGTREEQWLDRDGLIARQSEKLRRLLREIVPANPFWTRKFAAAGIDAAGVRGMDDLRQLPLTTKQEIAEDQRAAPPYGTNLTYPLERYTRLHQTSGTTGEGMRWLDTPESWDWFARCWQIIYDAAGVRPADRLLFAFSFGPFIGFWAAFEGAQRRGCLCVTAGGMSSAARLRAILEHAITVVCCTPTYALHLVETARAEGFDLAGSAVRLLIVAGEPGGSLPGVRDRIEAGFGARVIDHTGMTEIGSLGVECVENPGGVHLIESECIVEWVDPATGALLMVHRQEPTELENDAGNPGFRIDSRARRPAPLPRDVDGELVLTNLGRWGSPLIRYRTGDIVRLHGGRCACGRHFVRMAGGIIGRSDDMLIIRGNNVYPSAIDSVIRQVAGVAEYQVLIREVAGLTALRILVEPAGGAAGEVAARVRSAIKERLFFQAEVEPAAAGSLPRFELKARRFVREG